MRSGQRVRLADPARAAARFWSEGRGIVGAGGCILPREAIDRPATVICLAEGCRGERGLIEFDPPGSNLGLWIDASCLKSTPSEPSPLERRIDACRRRIAKLDARVGELMSQRASAEEELAELLEEDKKNGGE